MLRRDEFANLTRQDKLFEVAGFHYFDANGDGRITLAEVIDKPNPALALLDTDHDCVITPEERRGTGTDSRSLADESADQPNCHRNPAKPNQPVPRLPQAERRKS